MRPGSLSEQMGAIAIVDALRLQQRQLQEHLDLPQRRAEVAARIRDHYRHQGTTCDDALIDQGVRAFFARRLVFEAPALPWWQRWLADVCFHRAILPYLLVLVLLCGGGLLAKYLDTPRAPSVPSNAGHLAATPPAAPQAPAEQYARLEQYRQLIGKLEAMPLPEDVRAKLLPWAHTLGNVVSEHAPAKADEALHELQVYSDYTASALHLEVPGADQMSGYERCTQAACQAGTEDGKAWFLTFQARNAQGQRVTMPMVDPATGKIALAEVYGVQVSRAEYLKAQQAKQASGQIDNPAIGSKQAYSLKRVFDKRVQLGGRFDNPAEASQYITASF